MEGFSHAAMRDAGAGLDGGEGGGERMARFPLVGHFEETLDGAFGFDGFVVLGGWGEGAVDGVVDELGDGLLGVLFGVGFGEIEAGDLEAVEEEAGAAGIDLVGGDAAEDFADGELEAGAFGEIAGVGEGEGGLTAAAAGRVLDGAAGGVVEVAEVFGAECGRGAAAAVGEDVAALEARGLGGGFGVHACGDPLPRVFVAKSWNDGT
jgi:hypothetical protein